MREAAAEDAAIRRDAWRMLLLLAIAEPLGMALWFSASAVAPQLSRLWSLTPAEAGWLTTTVQLGFVAGTALAAVLNLADLIPARRYFALSALLAALVHALLALAPSYPAALVIRFLSGMFLAGVYPPAMKMVATWFRRDRGLAIGILVGTLAVGKASPYLLGGIATLGWRFVVATGSAGALAAAALVFFAYRDGPYPFERRAFSWGLVGTVVRHRETRLATAGYLGHMWELYAMWAALSLFFFQFFSGHGAAPLKAGALAGVAAFSGIAVGGLGSAAAGAWADRLGRENVAAAAMAVSGACALVIGWLGEAPALVVVSLAMVWGFAVVADSAQFSALVTEVAPKHAVGTALTLQTSLGFLLTAVSIWFVLDVAGRFGWGPAFSMLAVGPALGIWAMVRLRGVRRVAVESLRPDATGLRGISG